ncbi:unnamed protein product [Jaminaea pallidilutea]
MWASTYFVDKDQTKDNNNKTWHQPHGASLLHERVPAGTVVIKAIKDDANPLVTRKILLLAAQMCINAIAVALIAAELSLRTVATVGPLDIVWGLVIVDEAHQLHAESGQDSFQGRFFKEARMEFRLAMSGTPLVDNLKKQWAALQAAGSNRIVRGEGAAADVGR